MSDARVIRVAGAIAEVRPFGDATLYELVEVGVRGLLGEVIRLDEDVATVQVFEETTGLGLEEPVRSTGNALMAQLGPGLMGSVLDGVGRPLNVLANAAGDFIEPGKMFPTLDPEARWAFTPRVAEGDIVSGGDVLLG